MQPGRDAMIIRMNRRLGWVFLGFFALVFIVYFIVIFPWMLRWGASQAELTMTLPGDEVVPNPMYRSTRAITINAPVENVWPWIAQLGQDRGGFYSYTWIENIMLADIHNAAITNPEWLTRQEGELLPLAPRGYPLGLVKRKEGGIGPRIRRFVPDQAMVLEGWGSFVLRPAGGEKTRFIVRDPTPSMSFPLRLLWTVFFEPGHFAMERQMMKGIKVRAENRLGSGSVGQSLATTGFILTAFIGAIYVALTRRKVPWLTLPFVYMATILIATADPQAALVGFTAITLIIAGCFYFRRRWWAYLLLMFVLVNVVLLLPWDAYTAFGLIFLVVFLLLLLRRLSQKELVSSIQSREEARRKSRA
jgi:hypothetical protein